MVLKRTPKNKANESGNDGEGEIVELYIWGGGHGLPSIDPESLQGLVRQLFISDERFKM